MDVHTLQQQARVVDLHNDTIVAHIRQRNASLAAPGASLGAAYNGVISGPYGIQHPPEESLQIDLPRMQAAGIDVGLFAVDVTQAHNAHLAYALDGLGFLLHDLALHAPEAVIVRNAQDLETAFRVRRPALVLAVEHADVTEGSLNVLHALYALSVRAIGLTHNKSSCAADGCWEAREGVGLTDFGVRLVQEMNRLGMLVDLAHVSPGAFYHALEVSARPVLFSHGNARALCDHPRNLTDDQLRALAQGGGVIGVSYVPIFVDALAPTLERLLDHIDHIAAVAGIQTVALGSDFDGGGTLIPDVLGVEAITAGLLARGYAEDDVRAILGENALRVLTAVLG
jgi:membrane dipeptidase